MHTIGEFLRSIPERAEPPVVVEDASFKEVVQTMLKDPKHRIVYVVDEKGVLLGRITLDDVKDVVFRFYLGDRVDDAVALTETVAELFLSDRAGDLESAVPFTLREDTDLRAALRQMMERDAKNGPVVDRSGRVLADIDIADLLELWLKDSDEVV